MKRKEWAEMDLNERLAFLDECAEKARARFLDKRDNAKEKIQLLNEKIARGERLTVDEFEFYTGIKFSHDMGGKMKDILSLSTCCLINPLCRKRLENKVGVCAECFAEFVTLSYKGVTENTCYNYIVLSETDLPLALIPYIDRNELRLESFGDVGTMIQAKNYIKFALANPHCMVSVWTKNPWLYDAAFKAMGIAKCPENFTVILSSQFLNIETKIPEKYRYFVKKTFTVYTAEYLIANKLPASFINCGGRSCKHCERCYCKANHSETHIHELLKRDTKKMESVGFTWYDVETPIPVAEKKVVDYSEMFI